MFKVKKTPLPAHINIKCVKDYRSEEVIQLLKNDFHGKCYLCEDNTFRDINVEHFIPQKGNAELRFEWNNLFYSCAPCNHTKSTKYKDILNCIEYDPEKYIQLKLKEPFFRQRVEVKARDMNAEYQQINLGDTIALLDEIYNGETTEQRKHSSYVIRKNIAADLIEFLKVLHEYETETDSELINCLKLRIRKELRISARFSSFKRELVRGCKGYEEFADLLIE